MLEIDPPPNPMTLAYLRRRLRLMARMDIPSAQRNIGGWLAAESLSAKERRAAVAVLTALDNLDGRIGALDRLLAQRAGADNDADTPAAPG